MAKGIAFAKHVDAKTNHRIGVGTTPNGMPLYMSIFGDAGSISDAWDVVVHIPIGALEVVLYVKNVPAEKKFHMKAVILLNGATIAETEFDIKYGSPGSINNTGLIDNIKVKSSNPSIVLDSCFLDCLKRHAPGCVGVCAGGVTSWACILCAGGTVACCAINCHC